MVSVKSLIVIAERSTRAVSFGVFSLENENV